MGLRAGDGSLINWVSDVSCVEEGIRSVAVKGVQFEGPWKRRTSRRGKLQLRYWSEVSSVVGHWEIVEDLEAMTKASQAHI